MSNKNMHTAKKTKNDEFYTLYEDVEKELKHYEDQFRDKVIYLPCDSLESNFHKYLKANGPRIGFKQLITTSDDFRTHEDLFEECDIVITNPPFSLFREFIEMINKYNKKFLVIGNMNAITYKEIFKLIKENKLWLGMNMVKEFKKPNGEIQKFGNINWFTNLINPKRSELLKTIHYYKGNENKYPKYDNYNAINVDRVNEIPMDYDGYMGVPITFLDKFNPEQFEIVKFRKGDDEKDLAINGNTPYFRIIIKRRNNGK